MKKFIYLFLLLSVWGLLAASALPGNTDELKGEPKLMVTAVLSDPADLKAGDEATLTITIKNTNGSRYVKNAIFSFNETSNEIIPVAQDSIFVAKIDKGAEFEWSLQVQVLPTASSGIHTAMIEMSYEDNTHLSHNISSKIYLEVRQPVRLSFDEPKFPAHVTQGDTQSFSLTLMNLGKCEIYNALLSFDIEGMANGGSVLIGTIESGVSKSGTTNFRVDSNKTGLVEGSITLTYEDDFGELYEKKIPLRTTIEQRVVPDTSVTNKTQDSGIVQLWWLFPVGGLVIVFLIIITIIGVKRSRLRKTEEAKL